MLELACRTPAKCHDNRLATLNDGSQQCINWHLLLLLPLSRSRPSLAPSPAEAAHEGDGEPGLRPGGLLRLQVQGLEDEGHRHLPDGWQPIGEPGAKWKVSKTLTNCWSTYGAGGKDYTGYWSKCK